MFRMEKIHWKVKKFPKIFIIGKNVVSLQQILKIKILWLKK